MYKILCDGELIHAPSLDNPERLVFGAKISQQANAADKLEFTIYQNNPGAAAIHKLTSVIEVYQDSDLLFRGRPIQSKEGWEKQITYTCEGGFAFFNDTIVRPYSFQGTVQAYLQQLVTSHNSQVPEGKQFTLRTVTVTDSNNNIVRSNSDYVTTMKEIQEKLVKNLGGYMVAEYTGGNWYLDYVQNSPGATSQKITLAKNLLDFMREQNAENIATGIIPLGAKDPETEQRITIESVNGGLDYIVDATAAAQYGLIFTTEVWDDVTVPANLLAKAQAKLTDYSTLIPTIQLTAVDLSIMDQSIDPIRLLDTVTVEDDQHAASGQYVVMQRTYNLSDPAADSVTFGGAVPTMSAATNKTAAEVQAMPAAVLQTASDNARAMLETATGGCVYFHYDENGVLDEIDILNTDSPDTATKIWRWNIGGWGYSDDGGATYTVAATMDGVIYATLIKAGILSSDNGKYWLNMANGEVKMESGQVGGWTINTTSLSKTLNTTDTLPYSDASALTTALTQVLLGTAFPTGDEYLNYDLNGDGQLNSTDSAILTNMSLNSRNLSRGHAFSISIDASTGEVRLTEDYSAALQGTGSTFSGTRKTKIMSGAIDTGAVCGKDAYFSNQMSANKVIYSTLQQSSDRTIKKKVKAIGKKLVDALKELNPVSFVYKHDAEQKERYGLIAQEVEQTALQGLVSDNGGLKGLNYMDLIPILIAGWQNHEERITNLEEDK